MKSCAPVDDLPRLVAACDALVAPTRYEADRVGRKKRRVAACPRCPARRRNCGGVFAEFAATTLKDGIDLADRPRRHGVWHARVFRSELAVMATGPQMHNWADMAAESIALIEDRE